MSTQTRPVPIDEDAPQECGSWWVWLSEQPQQAERVATRNPDGLWFLDPGVAVLVSGKDQAFFAWWCGFGITTTERSLTGTP